MTELERVEENTSGESPPPVELRVVGRCADAPRVLERIRHIMRIVAEKRQDDEVWPTGPWWRENLPSWFTSSFRPTEEPSRHPDDWDLDSWLYVIKSPEWQWWSCLAEHDRYIIKLQAYAYPYAIGVFEHLARVAGADVVEITEEG